LIDLIPEILIIKEDANYGFIKFERLYSGSKSMIKNRNLICKNTQDKLINKRKGLLNIISKALSSKVLF